MPTVRTDAFDILIVGLIALAVVLIGRRMADPQFIAATCFGS